MGRASWGAGRVDQRTAELEAEVIRLRERVVVLEASAGKVALTPPALALVWAVALGVVGGATASAVSAYQVREVASRMEHVQAALEAHVSAPGHPVALERTANLDRRVGKLEEKRP